MATAAVSREPIDFESIEKLVKEGKTVVSADDSVIIDTVTKAIEDGVTATFYLKPVLFRAIRKRYWTPERLAAADLQALSPEEASRIKLDFNLDIDGCSSKETCPRCDSVYGTYEFIQQGIKEHGEDAVKAVFALEHVAVLQVHPRQNIFCQNCGLDLALMAMRGPDREPRTPHSYDYWQPNGNAYACCV